MRRGRYAILALLLGLSAVLLLLKDTVAPSPSGFLGLELAPVTQAAASRAPLLEARGALITKVTPGGPAARAKILPGEILAAIDGHPVNAARGAAEILRAGKPGQSIRLTLFDVPRGDIHPRDTILVFDAAPPVTRDLSVLPPRLLAREMRFPDSMAANAAWSRRMRGAANPLPLTELQAPGCKGFAPQGWRIREVRSDLLHLESGDGSSHAIYKSVTLDSTQARDPAGFVLGLVAAIFGAPPQTGMPQLLAQGFHRIDFGTANGVAGFAIYRLNAKGHLSVWIDAVPASNVADMEPLAAATVFSIRCAAAPKMDQDLAATVLARFHLGYARDEDGNVFLVNPRRDLWAIGPEGPGFYRQTGGAVEKLTPGLAG
jgi:hypothetical protein